MQIINAVLVSLSIRTWDANRQDNRVSKDVAEANNVTDKRLCRVRKSLLPKTAVMDRLHGVVYAARGFHYANTHAWMHDGPRILAVANFDAYMNRMREFKADFDTAVLDFLLQYQDIRLDAHSVLGNLYDIADYPDKEQLKSRYGLDMKVQPMPASTELLELGLDSEEANNLRQKLEEDMKETFGKANRRMWEELFERVEKLKNKLNDGKATLKEDALTSVREFSESLPRLNITDDERLIALSQRVSASLKGITADSIKHNPELRERLTTETQTLFNVVQSVLKPVVLPMPFEYKKAA